MARVAYQLAMASDKITADVVEVQEFPDIARKYQIRGVPMTVVNESATLMGAVPAMQLVNAVETAGNAASDE
jgi:predicted DsbA family dithiol-disulfide isomerase